MNSTPGYADPDTAFFRALHSTKGQNWNSWSVPELDAALEQGRRTMDPKKRKEIYDRVQIMILENVPHLWLFSAERIDFTQASCAYREVTVEVITRTGWIQLILPDGWAARVGPLSTYTGHISNRAAEMADPGAPTVIVTGHPLFGYIKIRQRRRRR